MSRKPKTKEPVNTRLASGYGGWIYCEGCGKTIGYLCYVTYSSFRLEYRCNCGSCGSLFLSFDEPGEVRAGEQKLIVIKNRLCCPQDNSPLFTVLSKNLETYRYEVTCPACGTNYIGGNE